ncbi:hypothetical protein J1N35_012624 [Gossypium stocksii]|uniref:Uncharacterized protein n=1 Tax=Gossypium stocksii TaxID=47602 RepID=A0A9D4AEL7_9ROSI|nr:hypothetical protein J1N35_012624 [Gossypium stocksii]
MEVSNLNGLQNNEEKALKKLLDAFESIFFSLNDIAYAYCEVDRNPYLVGLILCEMQGIPPLVSTNQSNNKQINQFQPLLMSVVAMGKKFLSRKWGFKISKAKGETGFRRHYFEHARKGIYEICHLANGSYSGTKPMKVDSKEMLMSLFWSEELNPVVGTKTVVDAFIKGIKIKQTKFSNRRTLLVLLFALTLYYRFLDCIFQEHRDHDHGIREAIQLLKYHLSSLASIL